MDKSNDNGLIARIMVPAGIVIFCLGAFWLSTQFDRVPPILKRGIQPSDFPQLVIGLIISLCAVLVFTDKSGPGKKLNPVVWKTMGLLVGFVLVAQADMFLGLGAFAVALAFLWGERRIHILAVLGIFNPLAVFLLFDSVFEIRFPRGWLTNLWYG